MVMETLKKYIASGIVYGKCWGGCEGGFKARKLECESREGILEEAQKRIRDGSLDFGMGFEKILGAILDIKEVTIQIIEGKDFRNEEHDTVIVGELSESQVEFLIEELSYQ
jgi:hypothetical protein